MQPLELLPGLELPEVQPYVLHIATADRYDTGYHVTLATI